MDILLYVKLCLQSETKLNLSSDFQFRFFIQNFIQVY